MFSMTSWFCAAKASYSASAAAASAEAWALAAASGSTAAGAAGSAAVLGLASSSGPSSGLLPPLYRMNISVPSSERMRRSMRSLLLPEVLTPLILHIGLSSVIVLARSSSRRVHTRSYSSPPSSSNSPTAAMRGPIKPAATTRERDVIVAHDAFPSFRP